MNSLVGFSFLSSLMASFSLSSACLLVFPMSLTLSLLFSSSFFFLLLLSSFFLRSLSFFLSFFLFLSFFINLFIKGLAERFGDTMVTICGAEAEPGCATTQVSVGALGAHLVASRVQVREPDLRGALAPLQAEITRPALFRDNLLDYGRHVAAALITAAPGAIFALCSLSVAAQHSFSRTKRRGRGAPTRGARSWRVQPAGAGATDSLYALCCADSALVWACKRPTDLAAAGARAAAALVCAAPWRRRVRTPRLGHVLPRHRQRTIRRSRRAALRVRLGFFFFVFFSFFSLTHVQCT